MYFTNFAVELTWRNLTPLVRATSLLAQFTVKRVLPGPTGH